jgi:hypothetical protein
MDMHVKIESHNHVLKIDQKRAGGGVKKPLKRGFNRKILPGVVTPSLV